jgi:antitoxin component YwqK of YwqJK toxin-antitoxin module
MRLLLGLLLIISVNGYSQCKNYIIGVKGDTLNCTDMKGLKQGRWVIRLEELRGEPGYEEEGEFVNNKREGTWRRFNLTGDLIAVENYRWGNKDGTCRYFTPLGDLLREEGWKAVNPENPYDTIEVPDVLNPTMMVKKVVKLEGTTVQHGSWKFYDPQTGMVMKSEMWVLGEIYKGDPAAPKPDNPATSGNTQKAPPKTVPKLKEIEAYEKKYKNKKHKERDGRTGY